MGQPAAEVDAAGKALDIGQGRPDRPIQFFQLHIGGDEAITAIEADRGTDEGTVDIDDVGLQHGRGLSGPRSGNQVRATVGNNAPAHRIGCPPAHISSAFCRVGGGVEAVFVICLSPLLTGGQPGNTGDKRIFF